MPHSIFFHRGFAIHGTGAIRSLGRPASHGCIRLHPGNAKRLFRMVRRHGGSATSIAITGRTPRIAKRRYAKVNKKRRHTRAYKNHKKQKDFWPF